MILFRSPHLSETGFTQEREVQCVCACVPLKAVQILAAPDHDIMRRIPKSGGLDRRGGENSGELYS